MRDFELAKQLISNLDLTSLGKNDTDDIVSALCLKALNSTPSPAAVCIWSKFVPLATKILKDSNISVATVVNFPRGGTDIKMTIAEIVKALSLGADEIDAVFPYEAFLSGNIDLCRQYLEAVTHETTGSTLKIILESGAFPHIRHLKDACRLCLEYNISFLKTSTGKTDISATPEAANAILETIKESKHEVGFKASGGIKTFEQARQYFSLAQSIMGTKWPLDTGHFRIGASSLLDDLNDTINKGF